MPKVLVIGQGWLGSMLHTYLEGSEISTNRLEEMDKILISGYDVVINCAARTNIDWCEKNMLTSVEINAVQAARLARICKEEGKQYVFFSSACIFESKDVADVKDEDSIPNPACFYAETKVLAERLILQENPESLIIRPRLPISEVPHPRNTIDKLLSYGKINNTLESVTVIEDLLPVLKKLIEERATGVYNIVNAGYISPAEIATAFGHTFETVSKEEQDKRLKEEGRARRVTTYVTSKRIPLLTDIRERMPEIVKKYNENLNNR